MKQVKFAAWAFTIASLYASMAFAQDLPRAGSFGVSGATTGTGGAIVDRVGPDTTAQALGIKTGDRIVSFMGKNVDNMGDVVRAMRSIGAGDVINLEIAPRAGTNRRTNQAFSGPVKGRPLETYPGGTTSYGAVAHNGGLLRDILVLPDNKPGAPVMYLIQGYSCYSIETMAPGGALYKDLIAGLLARGIGFYRIEKADMGDSRGGTSCAEGGFNAELDGFKAGYEALRTKHGIAPDRIFMLGHSMGGVQAPLVAAASGNQQPRGVAIYGSVLRNWHDYMLELVSLQGFFSSGNDPAEFEAVLAQGRPALRAIFLEGKTIEEAAALSPQSREFLTKFLNWTGGPDLMARRHHYWSEVTAQRLTAAWRDTKSQVLTMYGEADFAAIDPTDHQRIVDVVNFYRPDTAKFVLVEKSGHGMQLEGTRAEVRDAAQKNAPIGPKPYNPEITKIIADWIDASMAKPSVASKTGA
jgi:pimeloyl-ACP methyl ester carboxylesterase